MDALQGETALVTGGTAGIGLHTAIALARRGARLWVTGRDEPRGRRAVVEIRQRARHDEVELIVADAASVEANLRLADQISTRVSRLDILVNNAGGIYADRRQSIEGLEWTLAINFAGPFALTTRLLPLLARSDSARIVNVVSSAFSMWKGDPFADLDARREYVGLQACARAKLLNVLFTVALARRLAGSTTVVNAVNPGMAWTPGIASLTPRAVPHWRGIWPIVRWIQRRASAEVAARAPVRLACAPELRRVSGRYFDGMKEKRLPSHVLDVATQERAWNLGERLLAESLAFSTAGHSDGR
jgi:retinol dehydrogenase-12